MEALPGMLSPPWQCQCGAEGSHCRGAGSSYLAESVTLLWELCSKAHPSVCFSSPAYASVSCYTACNPSLSALNQLERRLVTEPWSIYWIAQEVFLTCNTEPFLHFWNVVNLVRVYSPSKIPLNYIWWCKILPLLSYVRLVYFCFILVKFKCQCFAGVEKRIWRRLSVSGIIYSLKNFKIFYIKLSE